MCEMVQKQVHKFIMERHLTCWFHTFCLIRNVERLDTRLYQWNGMELNWIFFLSFFRVEHFCMWKLKLKRIHSHGTVSVCFLDSDIIIRAYRGKIHVFCWLFVCIAHRWYWHIEKRKKGSFGWLDELCVVTVHYTHRR